MLLRLADAGDHHVGLPGKRDGLGAHLVRRARIDGEGLAKDVDARGEARIVDEVGTLGVKAAAEVACRRPPALPHGVTYLPPHGTAPGPLHVVPAVPQRAAQGSVA